MKNIIFEAAYSDYEEGRYVLIWESNGLLFLNDRGNCPAFGADWDEIRMIEDDEAMEIMIEMEAFQDV